MGPLVVVLVYNTYLGRYTKCDVLPFKQGGYSHTSLWDSGSGISQYQAHDKSLRLLYETPQAIICSRVTVGELCRQTSNM